MTKVETLCLLVFLRLEPSHTASWNIINSNIRVMVILDINLSQFVPLVRFVSQFANYYLRQVYRQLLVVRDLPETFEPLVWPCKILVCPWAY